MIRKMLLCGICTAVSFTSSMGLAQVAEPTATENTSTAPEGNAEIVVTAQRRSERLQTVPVSVAALTSEQLAEQHIESITDLAAAVPGMTANGSLGRNVPIFALRGVSLRDPSFNQDGPIAAYYDDVYKGTFALLGVYMYDLERVEVLKGPQGTLYGKNTTGGAINMVGRKPGPDTDGYLKLGYGNYDHKQAEGAVNIPVTSDLFTRLAFVVDEDDGWAKNVAPGKPNLSSTDDFGVRGTALYKPTDSFDFTLRAYYSRRDPYYDAPSAVRGPLGIGRGIYELFGGKSDFRIGLDRRTNDEPFPTRNPATAYSISGIANLRVSEALTLTSVSSWDDGKIHVVGSPDGSYLRVIEVDYFARTKQVSQEFRLSSDGEGRFKFISGLYYNRETTDVLAENRFFKDIDVNGDGLFNVNDCKASLALKLAPVACGQRNSYDQVKTSAAAYADSSYEITPTIKLRGGLRFTHDTGDLNNFYAQLVGAGDSVPLVNTIPGNTTNLFATTGLGFRTNNLSGRVGLDYTPRSNILLYGSYSRGYRGSAFNGQAFSSLAQLNVAKPEIVDAFEAGFKTDLVQRLLRVNGALFWYNYKDQQSVDANPHTVVQQLIGLPKSRILGAELEIVVRPTRDFSLSGDVSLLDTKIIEGFSQGTNVSGHHLIGAPPVSFTTAADWRLPLRSAAVTDLHVDGSYTGKQYYDLLNRPTTTQGGYFLLNSNIRFHTEDNRYGLSFWMKNITNRYYVTLLSDFTPAFGVRYGRLAASRTYGVSVDAKF